jgi:hypothetical protein
MFDKTKLRNVSFLLDFSIVLNPERPAMEKVITFYDENLNKIPQIHQEGTRIKKEKKMKTAVLSVSRLERWRGYKTVMKDFQKW